MRSITEEDFTIVTTQSGATVRWKHNGRVVNSFRYAGANRRAKSHIDFLVKWFASEGYKIDSVGYIEKSGVK